MPKFKKKPVEVEAIQYTGDNFINVATFCGFHRDSSDTFEIQTFNRVGTYSQFDDPAVIAEVWDKLHSTWVGVKKDQWIIKGVQGEFYPCDEDVFESTYQPAQMLEGMVEVTDAFADIEETVISWKGENYYSEEATNKPAEEFFYHDADTMDKVYASLSVVGLDEEMQAILLEEFDKHGLLIRELRSEEDIDG